VSWGPIEVDLLGGFAQLPDRLIELQPLQLRILGFLVGNAGRIVSRGELSAKVFRVAQRVASTSLARQISIIRTRLGPAKNLIVTTGWIWHRRGIDKLGRS
jgi:DNA-binding winged helix-turn-helix (wHTH) protein